ncbi:invertase [Subtercola boreus]|uniref:Invertase n=1 Tax=Subtercola boreus TaxID=120213 RepID=A0A3E0VE62_9MICO|nr:recombinase family protein [Subtercola boreus]RFA07945.1 invertase [Subtercola boreus]TQL55192.1 DNA invertase Pin-like site-specific DNA recombinase [Subtercola boreus]
MTIIAYSRVSTADQNPQLQLDALKIGGAEKFFTDHGVSGTLASRPELDKCLDYLRAGDTLLVWKLDRLGRNTRHTLALLDDLAEREINFRSLTEGIDTSGAMGRAMITVIAAFAQLERDTLIERTKAGLAVARESGRTGGRPLAMDEKKLKLAQKLYDSGDHTKAEIAQIIGVGVATIYRHLGPARVR